MKVPLVVGTLILLITHSRYEQAHSRAETVHRGDQEDERTSRLCKMLAKITHMGLSP